MSTIEGFKAKVAPARRVIERARELRARPLGVKFLVAALAVVAAAESPAEAGLSSDCD